MNNNATVSADMEVYSNKIHRSGRFWTAVMIVVMISFPVGISLILGTKPNLSKAFWMAFVPIILMDVPSGLAELIAYAPLLGTGGTYLGFITGNLSNLKIPCAMNARRLMDTKVGTTENEIVSTISIATSALTTTLVLALGVFLIAPLTPVLESPVMLPAFKTVMPAMFGALGCKYAYDAPKTAIIPMLSAILIFMLFPQLTSNVSIMVFVMVVIGGLSTILLYRKGWIK